MSMIRGEGLPGHTEGEGEMKRSAKGHESHLGDRAETAKSLAFLEVSRGQIDPRHCPRPREVPESANLSPLGEPLTIDQVATLLGCSAWTIRQKYLPQGLPHLRTSTTGKFTFFHKQVIDWILKRQGKGGPK